MKDCSSKGSTTVMAFQQIDRIYNLEARETIRRVNITPGLEKDDKPCSKSSSALYSQTLPIYKPFPQCVKLVLISL
jgi:hypothetical protein